MKVSGLLNLVGLLSLTHSLAEQTSKPSDEVFVASECYGNTLSVMCRRGYRIRVVDDFFGVSMSGGAQCSHIAGDCTVVNGRGSSVVHRYCQGKQECTTFQVDRRYCGLNLTNYEQVEYQCISESDIIDMCSSVDFVTSSGYFASPNFPYEYPANLDCQCTLQSLNNGQRVRLEAIHFTIKYDSPCRDWLEIASGHYRRRLCGAYRSTLVSDRFRLSLHTDRRDSHQGLWLFFNAYPNTTAKGNIRVRCYNPATGDNESVDENSSAIATTRQLFNTSVRNTHAYPITTHTPPLPASVGIKLLKSLPHHTTPGVTQSITKTNRKVIVINQRPQSTRMITSYAQMNRTNSQHTTPSSSRQVPVTGSKLFLTSKFAKHIHGWPAHTILVSTQPQTTLHHAKSLTARPTARNWEHTSAFITTHPTVGHTVMEYKDLSQEPKYRLQVPQVRNLSSAWTTRRNDIPLGEVTVSTVATSTLDNKQNSFNYRHSTAIDTTERKIHANIGHTLLTGHYLTVSPTAPREVTQQSGEEGVPLTLRYFTDHSTMYATAHSNYSLLSLEHTTRTSNVYNSIKTSTVAGTGEGTETDSQSYVDHKTTGFIIIAVSVGGILTLLIILAVLICVNKGRSKVSASNQSSSLSQQQHRLTQRLQQRLNSLTFYDSIPLHDGQQRRHVMRTGSLARDMTSMAPLSTAIPLPSNDASMLTSSSCTTSQRHVAPASRLHLSATSSVLTGNESYWANIQPDTESDCDAMAGGGSSMADGTLIFVDDGQGLGQCTPELSLATMAKTERQTPEGQAKSSGLCINLHKSDSIDDVVYTHV